MVIIGLSILSSSIIFVVFKLFKRYRIDTFQAIVFNYFTACAIGLLLFRNEWNPSSLEHIEWLAPMLICSVLFISLFLIMGLSSQFFAADGFLVYFRSSSALKQFGLITNNKTLIP